MQERVTGPFNGYWVVAYACEMGELGKEFLGYYKICADEPESFATAKALRNGSCETVSMTAQAALERAEMLATMHRASLPPLDELRKRHSARKRGHDSSPGM